MLEPVPDPWVDSDAVALAGHKGDVFDAPLHCLGVAGKVVEITKFANQFTVADNPKARARMRLLNISPKRTHITGPQEKPKAKTNTLAEIKATHEEAPESTGAMGEWAARRW